MAHWLEKPHANGAFAGKKAILEFGLQDLVLNKQVTVNFFANITGKSRSIEESTRSSLR